MTDPPAPTTLPALPDARLLLRALLSHLPPLWLGGLFLLAFHAATAGPADGSWSHVGLLAQAFLLSLVLLIEASIAWEDHRRAGRLLAVPLPDAPGLWLPEDLPLSAHGRIALAQAAPVPRDWALGHDGRHAYVVRRAFGRWQRIARRWR